MWEALLIILGYFGAIVAINLVAARRAKRAGEPPPLVKPQDDDPVGHNIRIGIRTWR